MRLKVKPTKPKRKVHETTRARINDGDNLQAIIDNLRVELEDKGFTKEEIESLNIAEKGYIDVEYDYDYTDFYYEVAHKECEASFNTRMNEYKTKLKAYNDWHKENKDEIEREIQRRKDEEAVRLRKKREQLEKERARIDKQLEKL